MKELKLKTTTGEEVTLKFDKDRDSRWEFVDLVEQEETKSAPTPSAGQWSAWQNEDDPKHPFYITKISNIEVRGIDFYDSENLYQCNFEDLVPVTTEEIESAFRKEATRRGFVRGRKIKCYSVLGGQIHMSVNSKAVYFGGVVIWDINNGWATLLPDKKPVPKTNTEAREFIQAYNLFNGSLSDFVKQYDFD